MAPRWVFAGTASVAMIVLSAGSARTGFHVGLNDFWGNVFAASRFNPLDPATLHNGFFPIGYPALISVGGDDVIALATGLNVLVWAAIVGVIAALAYRTHGWAAAVLTAAIVTCHPSLFASAISAGSDIPACALFAGAAAWASIRLSSDAPRSSPAIIFAIGFAFGAAGLLRYHLLVASGAFIAGILVVSPHRRTTGSFLLLGLASAYAPQVAANLLAGHGPFDTAQGFNVHRMTYGVDWFRVSPEIAPRSVLDVIARDPSAVGAAYLRALRHAVPFVLVALVSSWPATRVEHLGRASLIGIVLYALVVSLGASSRAWLPWIPITALLAVCTLVSGVRAVRIWKHSSWVRLALATSGSLLAAALLVSWLRTDVRIVESRRAVHAHYWSVETLLFANEGVRNPANVFTSDFDLYFPGSYPHTPFRNGGWMRYDLEGYADAYPEVCTDSVECFSRDCRRRAITHVVLGPTARRQSEALGAVYNERGSSPDLVPVAQVGPFKVFRVMP